MVVQVLADLLPAMIPDYAQAPASARTFISFMRPDFVKEKIPLYNLLILRITSILKIMLVIDNPYGSR